MRLVDLRVTLGAVLLAGHMLSAGQAGQAAQMPAIQPTFLEQAFGTLEARDLRGRAITTSSLRGRVVVLDFWATWCAPCLAELPTYQRLRRTHDPSALEIVGISLDVLDRRSLTAWLNRHRVTWTQVHDGRGYSGPLAQQFQVTMLPTTFVFDRDGRLAAVNVRGERLEQTIAALVGKSQ